MANESKAKVAVVTGASVGIGGGTAKRLLDDGWCVVGVDIKLDGFEALSAQFPGQTVAVLGDVAERDTHARAVAAAGELGMLTGWVNNAGIEIPDRAHDMTDASYHAVQRVNMDGVAFGCSAAVNSFLASKTPGAIVNVGSVRGIGSLPDGFSYEATKGAVEQMTRSVAIQYGHRGIRSNGVRPGAIFTPLSLKVDFDPDRDVEEQKAEIGEMHPLGRRMIEVEEVAAVIAFLLSDDASAVSGTMVNVDGALTASLYAYEPPDDLQ